MSAKPDLVPQETIVEQVKGLLEQKHKLTTEIQQLQHRLELLNLSINENDHLKERVQHLTTESLSLFEEEWKRRAEYYPDIWLAVLEAAVTVVQP
jgi:DNA repair exonuclease SbcCD ATPase subunit